MSFEKNRESQIEMEAVALWRQVHDRPPPPGLHGAALLDAALRTLPEHGYNHLVSPYLRPSQIAGPR